MKFKCGIFDLDGVITQTRDLHLASWKKLFDEYLSTSGGKQPEFTESDYTKYVDGKPRYDGVKSFLESRRVKLEQGTPADKKWTPTEGSKTTVCALGNAKDAYFNEALQKQGAKVYDSTVEIIKRLKDDGVKIGVASSSKNCRLVLEKSGLISLFDEILDGVDLEKEKIKGKPNPDMFVKCLERTVSKCGLSNVSPQNSILVEDAQSGVEAGRKGNFGLVIGIDRGHNRDNLLKGGAHVVVNDFSEVDLPKLDQWFDEQTTKLGHANA